MGLVAGAAVVGSGSIRCKFVADFARADWCFDWQILSAGARARYLLACSQNTAQPPRLVLDKLHQIVVTKAGQQIQAIAIDN